MNGEYSGGFEKSGKAHESFLLGEIRKDDPEYNKELRKLGADARGYLPFYTAKELAILFQPLVKVKNPFTHKLEIKPQDPVNPEKVFPKELRQAIIEALDLELTEDMDRVKYYTAVGSPLDYFHGTDAFIVLEGKNPGDPRATVTFDVTLKTEVSAKQDANADVIINEDLAPPSDPKFLKQVADLAAQAVRFLKNPRH